MKYISLLIVLLLAAAPAMASETSGEATLGGRFVSGNNTKSSAKFLEYQDIQNQVTSDVSVVNGDGNYYINGEARNIGYDDQQYLIKGGHYGKGKFSLWYDELTHNYSLDDKTLHTGTGSGNLVFAGVDTTDSTTWLNHDFKMDRSQTGASFQLTFDTPFFVAGEVTRTEKEGTYPIAVQDTSRNPMEIPAPIDYTTSNFLLKAGYRTEKIFTQVDVMFSDFDNGADLLEWENTGSTAGTTYTLAPDNDSIQVGGQVTVRDLPLKSIFALRGSYAKNESNPTLPALAGGINWDGEQSYTNISASLKSRPLDKLHTSVSYKYTKKDNDADSFDYPDAGDAVGEAVTHAFEYTKQVFAVDGSYRFNRANRLKGGFDYENVDRPQMRHDAEESDTYTLFAEWKNSSLEMVTSKLRYEYLTRDSDFKGGEYADMFGPQASEEIARYNRPFDAADKDQNTVRWQLEVTPTDMIDLGLDMSYSKSDYDETVIGRTEDKGHALILDATVALPMSSKLYAYVAYDKTEISSSMVRFQNNNATRHIDAGVPVAAADENTNRYNWDVERKDVGTSYGVKYEIPLLEERLKLSAAWDFQKNNGEADFSSAFQDANSTPLEDIKMYDDYKKQTLTLTGEYDIRENLTMIVAYTYQKFEQDDILTNDYENIVDGDNYFSGAYADMNYEANIGSVALNYRF